MANISLISTVEKNRLSSDVAFIPLLQIQIIDPTSGALVETAYVARNPTPIVYKSITYEAGSFDIELKSDAGVQPTVSLVVRDMTRAIQARMQAYGGGVGFNITILIIADNNLDGEPEVSEYFMVIGASATNYIATFTLGAENALTKPFPRRRQRKDFCPYRFKDVKTCKYSGPLTTCDYTLQGPNGCATHSNTVNFGAYPGLNRNGLRYD